MAEIPKTYRVSQEHLSVARQTLAPLFLVSQGNRIWNTAGYTPQ